MSFGLNYSTVQEQLRIMRSGDAQEKKKITPESIKDIRVYIEQERRVPWRNYTLEWEFKEWEDLAKSYEQYKWVITATAATQGSATVTEAANWKKTSEQLRSELESSLTEFSEKDFGTIKTTIEKATKLIEWFEKLSPEYREAMRGALGLMLLERFEKAWYKVILQWNKINVTTQKQENTSMATQLETYFRGQNMNEIFALGMIYRSSEIKSYSDIYINADKRSIQPETPRNYLEYLTDAQGRGGKPQNPNDQALLESRSAIQSILSNPQKVKGIIVGTPFLASALEIVANDPKLQSAATQAAAGTPWAVPQSRWVQTPTAPTSPPSPSTPLPEWSTDPVTRTFSEIGQWFSGGINKIMSTPGAFGGLLIASIATWIFGDFKKGLMVLAGGFWLSGIVDRFQKNGVNLGQTAQSAANTTSNAVAWAASSAAAAVGLSTAPAPTNIPAPSPFQSDLRKKVEASGIGADVDRLANIKWSKYPWKLDDYLKFIEIDMKDIPLSKLFPADHKKSIFYPDGEPDFSVDKKLAPVMLKKILREYLTWSKNLTGTGDKAGEIEKEAFFKQHNLTSADIQNKKLSDILSSVHQARTSWTPVATPAPVATPVATPAPAPAPAVAPITKHKIGNMDVDVGKSVQTNIATFAFGADGKEYINTTSKLPKDTNGKLHIPKDGVVKLWANVLKINWVDHVEVEYSGEKVYVLIDQLKPIKK